MIAWRASIAAALLLVLGLPLCVPLCQLLLEGHVEALWTDPERLASLSSNTLVFAGGTLLVALPCGVAVAVLLFRTDLPGRRLLRSLIVLSLFLPVPLLVVAWQAALGAGGWLPLASPGTGSGPWAQGLLPAILINALAVLPPAVLLIGHGLTWVETELEEDALLSAGPWRVLWRVTLPRCRAMIAAAGLWIILQSVSDIAVADALLVPTYAEEINVQVSLGEEARGRAIALSMPAVVVLAITLLWAVPRLDRELPPLASELRRPRPFALSRTRWLCLPAASVLVSLLMIVPLASLLWRVGLSGNPPSWSEAQAQARFVTELRLHGWEMTQGLAWAAVGGLLASALALLSCWAALDSPRCRTGLWLLVALAWALPGPVAGVGLSTVIQTLVACPPLAWLGDLMYRPNSPAPVVWAYLLRFFPLAVALLWPLVRSVPRELREAARLDGARPYQEMRQVLWPLVRRGFLWIVIVITALCLGEVAVSGRVEAPGAETFAKLILDRLHYGAAPDVAALCLVLLTLIALPAILASTIWALRRRDRW